jgi:citrate lyase subunit beta/citryl-CoA lyase
LAPRFTAKFAIHPKHIPAIRRAFLPEPEEVNSAEQILQQARSQKKGAFAWRGEMIDEAQLKRARQIIEKSHSKTENL